LLFNFLKKYTKKELDEFVCLTLSVLITIDVNPGFTLEKRKLLYLKNGKNVIKTNLLKNSYLFKGT